MIGVTSLQECIFSTKLMKSIQHKLLGSLSGASSFIFFFSWYFDFKSMILEYSDSNWRMQIESVKSLQKKKRKAITWTFNFNVQVSSSFLRGKISFYNVMIVRVCFGKQEMSILALLSLVPDSNEHLFGCCLRFSW
ncbi:hypothetical protein Dsin_018127 [Dipteronia sinensis]|uniref:Uncharacterized protein n=1 Tax=Dipteronia sinensis TaxID=43782 RepID=A0AAE0AGT7_9ROSI|nr:hypothetical protein Dsin_018127 [Dipteronia sinensis]